MVTRITLWIVVSLTIVKLCKGTKILVTDKATVKMSSEYSPFQAKTLFDGNTTFESCCCAMTDYESKPYYTIDLGSKRPVISLTLYGGNITMYGGAGNLLDTSIWFYANTSGPANLTIAEPRDNVTFTFPMDTLISTIHIMRQTTNRFALCELELWSPEVISYGKQVVSRKDGRCNERIMYEAAHAVDGVYDSEDLCSYCASIEDFKIDPWLQLDLGQLYRVSFISLYGRTQLTKHDLLDNVRVYFDPVNDLRLHYYQVLHPVNNAHIALTPDRLIQYVTLVRVGNYILTICEILVFGRECLDYKYGTDCSLPCGQCQDSFCDVLDGSCAPCKPGYYGKTCQYAPVPMSGDLVTASTVEIDPQMTDAWSSAHVVDGIVACVPATHTCCMATQYQDDPWLQLELPEPRYVWTVDIIGFPGTQGDFEGLMLFVSEDRDASLADPVYTQSVPTDGSNVTVIIDPPAGARFVTLVLPGKERALALCEINIFGKDCPDQKYDLDCGSTCGHCLGGERCDLLDGTCLICEPGYTGDLCDRICPSGTYGQNCANLCGHCSETCNPVNGTCISCLKKYYGNKCLDRIVSVRKPVTLSTVYQFPSPLFWSGSKAVDEDTRMFPYLCLCCSGTQEEEKPWLQVDLLYPFRLSRIGIYGRTDDQDISLHHISVYLAPVDSAVGEPYVYWTDFLISLEIIIFPLEVSQYVTMVMDQQGALFVCEIQVFAQECEEGWFGTDCITPCHCLDDVICDALTGACPDEQCASGWIGPFCDTECPDGQYGIDCLLMCGACANLDPCNKSTGVCERGCTTMYLGDNCKDMQSPMTLTATVWGFISFGIIAFISIVVFIGFTIKRRKQKRRERAYRLPPPQSSNSLTATDARINAINRKMEEARNNILLIND